MAHSLPDLLDDLEQDQKSCSTDQVLEREREMKRRLSSCKFTETSLITALMPVSSPPTAAIWGTEVTGWALKHLDLSFNRLNDSGIVLLSARLEDPHCKLEKLRMSRCSLIETCCYTLGSVLGSNSSPLRELDVSSNDLQDSGMKMLSAGLGNPHCKLEILSLNQN
ncbi:ribonuclease inhibitor-like isoform X2 [Oncorhynchus mykiss]|uniref:ribonuclease inhibitor-like isoform X2 n=1 Tax=Oncorhynchus mykiss TaxID=8022 RepID=UPI001878F537|nr:ribonuclease inhibitor-like isoform X2 [Oncorhynchus mykiss]